MAHTSTKPGIENMMNLFVRMTLFSIALLPFSSAMAQTSIFACEPEWASLAKMLGGDKVKVFKATKASEDPHYIQARPSLIARLRNADLAVCTGAELEVGWMPMLQRKSRNPKVLSGKPGYLETAGQVNLLDIPKDLDRSEGDIHADGNPHVQLDPRRLLTIANAVSARLQSIDPENKSHYEALREEFSSRWQSAILEWEQRAAILKGKKVIVHHREWIYLLDWLGMERVASLEPKPGISPSLEHLSNLKQHKVDFIITSPLDSSKPSQWMKKQAGTPVIVLPHTVGAVENSDDLFDFFNEIIRRLTDNTRA